MKCVRISIYIVVLFILFISSQIATAEDASSEVGGELHCYLGIIGAVFVFLSCVFGLLTSRRFGPMKRWNIVSLHFFFSVLLSVFFTGQSLFGVIKANWTLILNFHGIIGTSLVIVPWLATIMSPCVAGKKINWKVSSKIHAIFAILLCVLVATQVLNGYLFLEG